jgi:hypothetical protein
MILVKPDADVTALKHGTTLTPFTTMTVTARPQPASDMLLPKEEPSPILCLVIQMLFSRTPPTSNSKLKWASPDSEQTPTSRKKP